MKGIKKGSGQSHTPNSATQRYKKESLVSQNQRVLEQLNKGIYTMKMLSILVNVDRANICRFVAELRKYNHIFLVKRGLCKVTNCMAGYYTTNTEFAPIDNQTKLF